MIELRSALLALAPLIVVAGCQAAGPPQVVTLEGVKAAAAPRTIEVTGHAECNTAPDEFILQVGVESFDRELSAAKADNDARMKALLTEMKRFGVEARDTRTDEFRIQPRQEGPYHSRKLVGYDVHKRLTVLMRDARKVEDALAALFNGGANRLYGVTFQSSKAIDKRKEARVLAVQAAKEKAEVMAKELGQELGRPVSISEASRGGGAQNLNFSYDNDTRADITDTLATGEIPINATVTVIFELTE